MDQSDELVGLYEVAEMARVSRPVVANWRTRDPRFPQPVADLRSGPVFRTSQIRRYIKRRKKHMTSVIATINLKGGVGKTTTTAALAEFMSAEFGKKILVIDLDPQTNLTTVLIGEDCWKKLNDAAYTLHTLFEDALNDAASRFDLDKTLQRGVSPVREVRTVDLLPSSLDLIDVQDSLASMPSGRYFSRNRLKYCGARSKASSMTTTTSLSTAHRTWSHNLERSSDRRRIHYSDDPRRTLHLWHPTDPEEGP